MKISRPQWEELVSHARAEAPNECCGIVRMRDGDVLEIRRERNERGSPYGFELGGPPLQLANEWDDEGYGVAVYHSHPRSPAEPSQTDINLAQYPHWLWLIVSLESEPEVRAWRIEDGRVAEEDLAVA